MKKTTIDCIVLEYLHHETILNYTMKVQKNEYDYDFRYKILMMIVFFGMNLSLQIGLILIAIRSSPITNPDTITIYITIIDMIKMTLTTKRMLVYNDHILMK